MKKISYYLDEYKKLKEIKSDYELSKIIGVGRSQISRARKGEVQSIGRKKYLAIAKTLKIQPIVMIATLEAEREKDDEIKKIWIDLINEKEKKSHP